MYQADAVSLTSKSAVNSVLPAAASKMRTTTPLRISSTRVRRSAHARILPFCAGAGSVTTEPLVRPPISRTSSGPLVTKLRPALIAAATRGISTLAIEMGVHPHLAGNAAAGPVEGSVGGPGSGDVIAVIEQQEPELQSFLIGLHFLRRHQDIDGIVGGAADGVEGQLRRHVGNELVLFHRIDARPPHFPRHQRAGWL